MERKNSNGPEYALLMNILETCQQLISDKHPASKPKKQLLKAQIDTLQESLNQVLQSQYVYRLIFDKAPVGIFQYDKNGIIIKCNDQFVEILGSSRDLLIGLDMKKLRDKKMTSQVHQAIGGNHGKYEGNYTSVTSGKTVPVRVKFSPVFDKTGKPDGGVGIVEDITETEQANRALKESEERYKNLFENNHSVMLLIDPEDGSIFDANPAAVSFYGYTRKQLRNINISEIYKLPESEINYNGSNKKNLYYYKHRLADGREVDVEVYSGLISLGDQKLLYSIVHNISERVRAVNELRKFRLGIERSPTPIFITNVNGDIEYVNREFTRLYGYKKDEAEGKNPSILKSGQQPDEFYAEFWQTILSGNVASGEMINKTKEGKLVHIIYSCNPIITENGSILGFLAIHDDITKRIHMERKIRESLYEKDVLLAEVHHRVKNNLAMISAMMMLQASTADNPELETKLMDSANRIKAISNIHEHIYGNQNFSSVNLAENTLTLVQNIIDSINSPTQITTRADSSGVQINTNQAVYCSLISNEVVTNIIKHAFKKRTSGTITVTVQEKSDLIELRITDNGNPLPENFKQNNRKSLGLELIHILTRQLEGSFNYETDDNGTSFILTFRRSAASGKTYEVEDKIKF